MFTLMMFAISKSQGYCNYADEEYPKDLLHRLDELRRSGHFGFCDVILRVENQDFTSHKNILAACSDYFYAMFNGNMKESRERVVKLSGVNPEIMKHVLRYIYTGEIMLQPDNVELVLQAANLMLIKSLKEACCKYLMNALNVGNCLGMQGFAEAYACTELHEAITKFIHENFGYVTHNEEFLILSAQQLNSLLGSDELSVLNEEKVYEALVRWVKYDCRSRKRYFPDLIEHIRFPMISPDYLVDQVESESLFQDYPKCRELLTEAHHFHLLPSRRGWFQTVRTRPRKYENTNELLIACGGNGEASSHSTGTSEVSLVLVLIPEFIPVSGTLDRKAIESRDVVIPKRRTREALLDWLTYSVGPLQISQYLTNILSV